jgi:hypothetical protein
MLQWRDIQSTARSNKGRGRKKIIRRYHSKTKNILVQSSKESMAPVDDLLAGHQTLTNKRGRSHSVIIPDEEEGELSCCGAPSNFRPC